MTAHTQPNSSTGQSRGLPVHLLVLISIGSVQLGSAWAATIFREAGPSGACLLRLASASVVMLAIRRPAPRSFTRGQWSTVCMLGLVLAGMNLAFYQAISRIPLGTAVTVEFVGPLLVALAGSRRPLDLLWALLAAGGIVTLCNGIGSGTSVEGLAFAAVAGLLWSAYILLQSRLGRGFGDSSGLAIAMTVAAAVTLVPGAAVAGSRLLAPGTLAVGAAVGMLSSAIPYSLELRALRSLSTGTFGVLMSLEPAVAALSGAIVLAQAITLRDGVGIGLVVMASLGASLASNGVL